MRLQVLEGEIVWSTFIYTNGFNPFTTPLQAQILAMFTGMFSQAKDVPG